ncbi:MAG TPA: UDP-2,3-diacylglucosamine diphosphatase [Chitinophagaceae bacterium]|nr:UDP-2,3-diacylglucosamine diphosphatase [Chitinophagaceae bacterium]
MQLTQNKKIYFLSDFHLGAPDYETSLAREKRVVKFLDIIKNDAEQIFILGDLFDFWYEYKRVVPKGFVRILGKLAELTDSGIEIHFFVGNHDMWMKGYFEKELNIKVYHHPEEFDLNGKIFLIGHGDGLGPGDHRYKFLKKVFRNKISQWLFGILHPGFGIGLADYFSSKSRATAGKNEEQFLGEDKEWLIIFSREMLKKKHYDYFIFGHRHLPINFKLADATTYINLGDWIKYNSYVVFDGENAQLKFYTD